MSARIEKAPAAALLGAALVMLGAWLPWLTLFAGLQRYGGFIGLHGRVLFGGGALALVASVGALRAERRALRWGIALLGGALIGFIWWLLVGLAGILHRGASAMLVPRAGPGLFVALGGAALVLIASVVMLARDRRAE